MARRRWPVLVLGLAALLLAAWYGPGVFGSVAGSGFAHPASESARAEQLATERFGAGPDVVLLYTSATTTVDDPTFRQAVEQALAGLPDDAVSESHTFWSTRSPALVSDDRTSTVVALRLAGSDEDAREDTLERVQPQLERPPPGLQVLVGGDLAVDADLSTQAEDDLRRAELFSLPVLLVLLVVIFGGVLAAGLPLLIGVLAILGSFAVLRALALVTDVSVFAVNVVTMLGLGLAVDYSLFVVSRFREELRSGAPTGQALRTTMATAGRTIAMSGLIVAVSLSSLVLFPQQYLRSMGMGGVAAVVIALVASLTVLPALLAVLGHRVGTGRRRWPRRDVGRHARPVPGAWFRVARAVMRRPVPVLVVVGVFLLALGAPFLRAEPGGVDYRALPDGTASREVSERLVAEFPGSTEPVEVVVTFDAPVSSAPSTRALAGYVQGLGDLPGATGAEVTEAREDTALVVVDHRLDPQGAAARTLVADVRALAPPEGAHVLVGGASAEIADLLASLGSTLPWMLLAVAAVTFSVLFLAFGSVVVPAKAIATTVLSLCASFGALVWIFQDGHLSGLLGFTSTGTLQATQPVLMFAVAFGLATDYEVFLLSRVREEWVRTGDSAFAVASALQRTGPIITSAALLLVVVIGAFSTSGITLVKMVGIGMVITIVIDATIVRALLVPATMALLGPANWWAPAPLRRFWLRHGLPEPSAGHPADAGTGADGDAGEPTGPGVPSPTAGPPIAARPAPVAVWSATTPLTSGVSDAHA